MRRKHARPTPPSTPKWFRFGLLAFIAFIIFNYATAPKIKPAPDAAPLKWDQVSRLGGQTAGAFAGARREPKLAEVKIGEGPPLLCGPARDVPRAPSPPRRGRRWGTSGRRLSRWARRTRPCCSRAAASECAWAA